MTTSILNRRVSLGRRRGGEQAAAFAATHALGVGRLTMGQAIPRGQVPSGSALAFAGLPTQCDVKTTWDDGSARFAVLSADVTSGGAYPLAVGTAATGTFSPTIPAASVTLTIAGTAYAATLPASVSSDPWLAGPVVREWRHRVTPTTAGAAAHPFLRVYFDVRVYSAGGSRVDVTVENCQDAVASSAAVTYDASVSVAGSVAYAKSAIPHYYLARWRKAFAAGGLSESVVGIDWAPAQAAGAVPKILASCDSPAYDLTGATFDPMGRGSLAFDDMGATGGRPEIAPYPDWAAAWMAHGTANQRATTLVNSDLAGSWPAHVRNADDSPVSVDARPNYWIDTPGRSSPGGRGPDGPAGDYVNNVGPLGTDVAHVPSFSYVPYLATGDRYHMEEMAFWGAWSILGGWQGDLAGIAGADGGRGGAFALVGTAQIRARGWELRNLVDAAAYLPDAHPRRAEWRAKVANNTGYYAAYAGSVAEPLGSSLSFPAYVNPAGYLEMTQWQCTYLAWALDHATRQGFAGAEALRDRIAAFQVKLLTSGPGWPPADGGPYYPIVGTVSGGVRAYYATMAEAYAATAASPADDLRTFAGNYGTEARLGVLMALAAGAAGAAGALSFLMAQPGMTAYVDSRPGYALDYGAGA